MNELQNIIEQLQEIVDILTPEELHRIVKPMRSINKSLDKIINHSADVLTLSDERDKHTYYVNNMYAKAQLSKLVPQECIMISPEIQLGTIIMVKQY